MRLSTQQFFMQNLSNVQQSNAQIFKYQQQMSTGKKLSKPSDDPLAATQINKFERAIARNEVFSRNVDVSERRLKQEESTLTLITETTLRIKDLAIQANNGSLTPADQRIIAEELKQLTGQLSGAVNTQDAQGEYLFSGFKGQTQPYQLNASGDYVYRGDSGQRFLDVGENTSIAATDPGGSIFGTGEDNLLNAVKEMAAILDDPNSDMDAFNNEVAKVDQFFEQTITTRSQIGARLKVLEDQREQLADIKLFTQNTLSSFQDTDYYEATSKLMLEQNALEATYATFGKIQQLTLFNYVN
ncbi:flagellar hook-associated protein FlgL [Nitrincola sp.]|uniref:flagellar hook-associated protein FlgL n=1 Tax=Nitrincola sp. TaxID=1926584 RepID=UPI003A8FAAAB